MPTKAIPSTLFRQLGRHSQGSKRDWQTRSEFWLETKKVLETQCLLIISLMFVYSDIALKSLVAGSSTNKLGFLPEQSKLSEHAY